MSGTLLPTRGIHPALRHLLPRSRVGMYLVTALIGLFAAVSLVLVSTVDSRTAALHPLDVLLHGHTGGVANPWVVVGISALCLACTALILTLSDLETVPLLSRASRVLRETTPVPASVLMWRTQLVGRDINWARVTLTDSSDPPIYCEMFTLLPAVASTPAQVIYLREDGEAYFTDDPRLPVVLRTPSGIFFGKRLAEQPAAASTSPVELPPPPRRLSLLALVMTWGPLLSLGVCFTMVGCLMLAAGCGMAVFVIGKLLLHPDALFGNPVMRLTLPWTSLFLLAAGIGSAICGVMLFALTGYLVEQMRTWMTVFHIGRQGWATLHAATRQPTKWQLGVVYPVRFTLRRGDGETCEVETVLPSLHIDDPEAEIPILYDPANPARCSALPKALGMIPDQQGVFRPRLRDIAISLFIMLFFLGISGFFVVTVVMSYLHGR